MHRWGEIHAPDKEDQEADGYSNARMRKARLKSRESYYHVNW
jgi:hypothetical protein